MVNKQQAKQSKKEAIVIGGSFLTDGPEKKNTHTHTIRHEKKKV